MSPGIVIQYYLLRHRNFASGIVNLNYDAPILRGHVYLS